MTANARIAKNKTPKPEAAAPVKMFKLLHDFEMTDRVFRLSETVVSPKVQKRIEGIDPTLGANKERVEAIFDKLADGHVTEEYLLTVPPLMICGLLDAQGKVSQYVRVDGHHRIPAMISHFGINYECKVKYFEATEDELWIASSAVNANNSQRLSNSELRTMYFQYLEDARLASLSDGALSELTGGQYVARNIGNARDALIIQKVINACKEYGPESFDGQLVTMVKKYAPEARKGLDGRKQNAAKTDEKVKALRINEKFDKIRPADKTEAPAVTPEPAAEMTEAPAVEVADLVEGTPESPEVATTPEASHPRNFVPAVGTLAEVSKPVEVAEEQDLAGYSYDAVGPKNTFEGVNFQTSDEFGTVEIITQSGAIVVPVAALKAFALWHDQIIHTDQLFDLEA